MNRRSFIKLSLMAGFGLVLPTVSSQAAGPAHTPAAGLRLQDGRILNTGGQPVANFGADLPVSALYQRAGIWYAHFGPLDRQFWLKSYNGRIWGSLDWQPKPNSPARF